MLICICCVIFITKLRVSFCIKFFKTRIKKKKKYASGIRATRINDKIITFIKPKGKNIAYAAFDNVKSFKRITI